MLVDRGILLVAPADGKVVEITKLPHDEFIGGPAVRIGIFLSIFNVHLNRAPAESRVIALRYSPGRFLNAMNPESSLRNENTWIALEDQSPRRSRLIVRQISGAIARRIVCDLRPGQHLQIFAGLFHLLQQHLVLKRLFECGRQHGGAAPSEY